MRRVTTEQRSLLPVVSPHLQNGLFERPRGEGVEDGVQGTVDGENEYYDPRADGSCAPRGSEKREIQSTRLSF